MIEGGSLSKLNNSCVFKEGFNYPWELTALAISKLDKWYKLWIKIKFLVLFEI